MKTRMRRFQLIAFHEVFSRIIIVLLFVCAFAMSGAENALAVIAPDLTPWLNPAGANNNGSPPPYNESNNFTTRPVVVRDGGGDPVIFCEFESPGDEWLARLPVLVVVGLTDLYGNVVGRQDLPESADGTISNPVVMVSCGAKTDENTLIFVPGLRRHPINLWTRLVHLGRNVPAGTCTVDVYSGDMDAYTLDPDSCHTEYEAVRIFGNNH
jgi:hypothetical protein